MRIGIFGGTFNPPHQGHLILASEAYYELSLDILYWVLTPYPPHKPNSRITELQRRFEMVHATIGPDPRFTFSTVDMDRPGPHYSVDTVRLLGESHPGAELIYLMGGDSLRDLPTWRRARDFLNACHAIGVMRRPGAVVDTETLEATLPNVMKKVRFFESPLLEISSHQIRQRVAEGRPYRYYLPESVYQIIEKYHLYKD